MLHVHSLPFLASASAGGHTMRWKFTEMTITKLITDMQSFVIAAIGGETVQILILLL